MNATSDDIIARWEELLRSNPHADLLQFWQFAVCANQNSRTELQALLFELIAIALESSWRHWEQCNDPPTTARQFWEGFPELGDQDWRDLLLVEEYRVRTRFGDRPTLGAFLAEQVVEHLRPRLQLAEQELQAEFGRVGTQKPPSDKPPVEMADQVAFDPRAPLRSADYLVQRFLGAGAFGRVYVAWQHSLQRQVALKFLRKSFLSDASVVDRFLREARLAGGLRHPGIIAVHGLGRTPGGSYFLAMDLINGGSLKPVDAEFQQLRTILDSLAQAAEAMVVAHAAGVIHCDLKPANILRDEQGRVTLTDFGLGRQLTDEPALAGRGEGTPACIAPEQVDTCWGEIGTATDVFNLAATLFLLLAGRSPHPGTSIPDVLASAVSGQPIVSLGQLCPSLPSELSQLCAECLCKSPASARPTMAAFARRLRGLVSAGGD